MAGHESPSETRLLLQRWRAGEQAALETLLERDLPWIRAYVSRRLGALLRQRMDTGDVVQEAMLEFLRHGPPFVLSDQAQFRRLAARVVQNVLGHQYDWFTAQRRDAGRERSLPSGELLDLDQRRQGEGSPSVAARRREREDCVRLGLELIDAEDREVILLREWKGLTLAAVGEQLGIKEDAARMRFNRAVRRLSKKVRQLHGRRLAESLDE